MSATNSSIMMLQHWDQFRGHENQRELFRRLLRDGRLSHAYVLAGPEGIGKRQFARLLALSLFCRNRPEDQLAVCGECRACRSFVAGAWPDFHEVGLLEGKTEILIGQLAGEGESRGREGLCYELSMTPQASHRRVAVINDAHRMKAEAANALLKTLEEPPGRALILLVTDNADALLPTIRSRAQLIRFFPLVADDVRAILLENELAGDEDEAGAVASVSEGSLAIAQQMLNQRLQALRKTVADALVPSRQIDSLNVSRTIIESIEDMSANTAEQRRYAQWLLKFVADELRSGLRVALTSDGVSESAATPDLKRVMDLLPPMLDRTVRAADLIEARASVSLVIESFFDDLARMRRSPVPSV